MFKKSIVTFLAVSIVSATIALPVFAQEQQKPGNQGFFAAFSQFFSRIFGNLQPNSANINQLPTPGNQNLPSGVPSSTPSGQPQTDSNRLQGLVTAGKITQLQEQEILTEVNKIKSEIQTWSQSTGIDAAYVYAGLRGPGMNPGIGNEPNGLQGAPPQNGPQGGSQQDGFKNRGFGNGSRGNQQ